jgi:prolyl 4-hydroxylase
MKKILSNDPVIYTIDNFLTKEECNHIINITDNNMNRGRLCDTKNPVTNSRTNDVKWLDKDYDNIILDITKKIANIIYDEKYVKNINKEDYFNYSEKLQVIRYYENQEYKAHYDGWYPGTEKWDKYCKQYGQRMITVLVYLSDVEEGGGTKFPKNNITILPKIGKLLVFHNCHYNTNILHDKSLHAGLPVIKGTKWAFNLWFREKKNTNIK